MATKLGRKEFPAGLSAPDFIYRGRPAKDQGDFGTEVGRIKAGKSWAGSFNGQDFQFIPCGSGSEARNNFATQIGADQSRWGYRSPGARHRPQSYQQNGSRNDTCSDPPHRNGGA